MVADFSLTFLGTGTSVGVPMIGCDCAVCTSSDPKNKRTRSSVVVRLGGTTVLVDSGPDLRFQALRENLREIDAIFYTHAHLDHVAGFDELRAFCWRRNGLLPLFATEGCLFNLKMMYAWAFSPENVHGGYVKPDPKVISGPFHFGEIQVVPLPVKHGSVETIGFLFEHPGAQRVAYLPDVKSIPAETMRELQDVDILIIDALRPTTHPTHFSLDDALAAATETNAAETWLTHLGHDHDHPLLEASLPPHVHVAYDGLRLPLAGLA